jgi:hypothetical protein
MVAGLERPSAGYPGEPIAALTPDGIGRTPGKDGTIYVLPVFIPVDLTGELACDWRHRLHVAVGWQNSVTLADQGLYPACSYSFMSPPRTGPGPDQLLGRAGDGVRLLRPELAAAMGVSSGGVSLVLSRMAVTEDQHLVATSAGR